MADLKALAETLVNLTIKEANELAGILKDDYGIEPAASAVAVAAAPGAADRLPPRGGGHLPRVGSGRSGRRLAVLRDPAAAPAIAG